jgi:threonine dehydratase
MDRSRLPADIALAANRIKPHIRETPLEYSSWLSEETNANVWLKLENLQITGSFKLRGAFNKLLTLTDEQRARGGVAASSGNHGAAIAYAMKKLGVSGTVFVPEKTSAAKVDSIRRSGSDVRFFGTDGLDTEVHARDYATKKGMCYLSPYNDAAVIAGQGSCGVEIARQLPDIEAVYVAVGGGGLISGVGSFLRTIKRDIDIVSVQPAASAVMTESVRAGKIVDLSSGPTLSDGTAGGIEHGSITFDICREIVTDYLTVSEEQIANAMREFIDAHHLLVEGAAGVAIAGLLADKEKCAGKNIVVLICGGNISREILRQVI